MPSGFANSADKLSAATRGGDLSSDSDETSASEREAGQSRKSQESRWEDCFQRLLKFREEHGNCLVPYRYKKDPQLGKWVSSQRTIRNGWVSHAEEASPLLRERARRLEAIGFQWSSKDPRHVPWEQRYEQLADFVKKYGHAQVPIGWEENVQLSHWVSTQRQEYKLKQRGEKNRLTDDRIAKLNRVKFVWEAQRGGPRRVRRSRAVAPGDTNPDHSGKIVVVSGGATESVEDGDSKKPAATLGDSKAKSSSMDPKHPPTMDSSVSRGVGSSDSVTQAAAMSDQLLNLQRVSQPAADSSHIALGLQQTAAQRLDQYLRQSSQTLGSTAVQSLPNFFLSDALTRSQGAAVPQDAVATLRMRLALEAALQQNRLSARQAPGPTPGFGLSSHLRSTLTAQHQHGESKRRALAAAQIGSGNAQGDLDQERLLLLLRLQAASQQRSDPFLDMILNQLSPPAVAGRGMSMDFLGHELARGAGAITGMAQALTPGNPRSLPQLYDNLQQRVAASGIGLPLSNPTTAAHSLPQGSLPPSILTLALQNSATSGPSSQLGQVSSRGQDREDEQASSEEQVKPSAKRQRRD